MAMRQMEWQHVLKVLSHLQVYPWIIYSAVCYLSGHLIRGLRTQLLVSRDTKISVLTASNIVVVGYAVNNILPVRIGELARAGMLSERTGIPVSQSLTVVFLERLFDGMVILILLIISAFTLGLEKEVQENIFWASLVFGIASAFILFIIIAPNRFLTRISKLIYSVKPEWHDLIMRFTMGITHGISYLSSLSNILRILLISFLVWCCDVFSYFLLIPIFSLKLNLLQAVFVMAITNLGIIRPSGPGHIILFRSFCVQGLTLLGVVHSSALHFAILIHLVIYILLSLWGGCYILWYGITLGLTLNLKKKAKTIDDFPEKFSIEANLLGATPSEVKEEETSTFILKLTEAALPLEEYHLTDQQSLVADVANFIQGEIKSLSKRFRVMLKAGLFAFRTLVWFRYFQSYSVLPLAKRTEIFNAWAYSNIPLKRQLFKMIRSTAILAFFEHPTVRELFYR